MTVLAYDLGASGGRAIAGRLVGRTIELEELHRFPNDPVEVGARLHWDVLRLYHEIKQGLLKAKHAGRTPDSVAIDSWAVDFGLVGRNGELLGNPYHYRDRHTDGVMEKLFEEGMARETIFSRTGIQFLPFNTIYQLAAMKRDRSPLLREASRFLMIPDLLRYFLTGDMHNEFTNATTTQLYNPLRGGWDEELLAGVGADPSWFGPVLQPGADAGRLRASVAAELGVGAIPVVAAAEHDTGSAVVAVPAASRSFAYLICGTWSLMGTETERPVLDERALALNFTNEGGAFGTYRLLKNIMGLWILQETKRQWEREGANYTYPELVALAERAPAFGAWIDPDDARFLQPGDMAERIRGYCRETGQRPPEGPGGLVRCILESLALKYRYVLELTEQVSGKTFDGLHMTGGGIRNELLCRWSANAIGKPVWAGPAEGSAIGNMAVQWIARGELADVWEARAVIRESFPSAVYEPEDREAWEDAYGTFRRVTGLA
ncbi:rhamnulokinase [Paenibacillus flagellatus]|uniref:Rhamnulokinase n=1 Tax=Paenibacillus flagellatus TaxID=2211139 RepID=A0A2V5JY74_9BACL|nr:rhamnulokinase family protein [Paenibacillus flagellatus]PYI51825.1 rhamnulokinase [Paenibacillus flagellatus]